MISNKDVSMAFDDGDADAASALPAARPLFPVTTGVRDIIPAACRRNTAPVGGPTTEWARRMLLC